MNYRHLQIYSFDFSWSSVNSLHTWKWTSLFANVKRVHSKSFSTYGSHRSWEECSRSRRHLLSPQDSTQTCQNQGQWLHETSLRHLLDTILCNKINAFPLQCCWFCLSISRSRSLSDYAMISFSQEIRTNRIWIFVLSTRLNLHQSS